MGLVDDKIDTILDADNAFSKKLEKADQQLLMNIIRIYSKFANDGVLDIKPLQLRRLEDELIKAINKTKYSSAVNSYVRNYDVISDLNLRIHKSINRLNINKVINENARITGFLDLVKDNLKGTNKLTKVSTSLDKLVNEIAQIIRQDIIKGVSFDSATERIANLIEKKKLGLGQWAGQISTDALSQYDGLQNNEVKKEFNLKYVKYLGSVKDTTRPFCFHVLRKTPTMSEEVLQSTLNSFIPDGMPSESTTTFTPDGKPKKKGSGMIRDTDIGNFIINVGGYRCRHRAIPTARP